MNFQILAHSPNFMDFVQSSFYFPFLGINYLDIDEDVILAYNNKFVPKMGCSIPKIFERSARVGRSVSIQVVAILTMVKHFSTRVGRSVSVQVVANLKMVKHFAKSQHSVAFLLHQAKHF